MTNAHAESSVWFPYKKPSQAKYKTLTYLCGYYINKYPGPYFLADTRYILHAVEFSTWWCVKLEIPISWRNGNNEKQHFTSRASSTNAAFLFLQATIFQHADSCVCVYSPPNI